jgi:hypothetical protein
LPHLRQYPAQLYSKSVLTPISLSLFPEAPPRPTSLI